MTPADLEAAAEEKYPDNGTGVVRRGITLGERAAYVKGRLDQAEADAQIAERWYLGVNAAAAIRKGVE